MIIKCNMFMTTHNGKVITLIVRPPITRSVCVFMCVCVREREGGGVGGGGGGTEGEGGMEGVGDYQV